LTELLNPKQNPKKKKKKDHKGPKPLTFLAKKPRGGFPLEPSPMNHPKERERKEERGSHGGCGATPVRTLACRPLHWSLVAGKGREREGEREIEI